VFENEKGNSDEDENLNEDAQIPLGIEEQMTIKLRDRATLKKLLRYRAETFYSECSDPQSYKEAMHSENVEKWKEAMSKEMSSLQKNETWKLVELPRNKKALNNGWVYRTKTKKKMGKLTD